MSQEIILRDRSGRPAIGLDDGSNPGASGIDFFGRDMGTWLPILGGTGGTSGQTYTKQIGYWSRIGRVVTLSAVIKFSAKGTITGNVRVFGMPFLGIPDAVGNQFCAPVCFFNNLAGAVAQLGSVIFWSSPLMRWEVYKVAAAGATGMVNITTADLTDTTEMNLSGSYFADASLT
jgi:hypothetical protein